MSSLRSKFVVPALLAGAAVLTGCGNEADKVAESSKAVASACQKLAGMTDEDAFKCVTKTWNHAVTVANIVDKNLLITNGMRAACLEKSLPDTKNQDQFVVLLKGDTEACFNAMDASLAVDATNPKAEKFKEMSKAARYDTQRALTFLPNRYQ